MTVRRWYLNKHSLIDHSVEDYSCWFQVMQNVNHYVIKTMPLKTKTRSQLRSFSRKDNQLYQCHRLSLPICTHSCAETFVWQPGHVPNVYLGGFSDHNICRAKSKTQFTFIIIKQTPPSTKHDAVRCRPRGGGAMMRQCRCSPVGWH